MSCVRLKRLGILVKVDPFLCVTMMRQALLCRMSSIVTEECQEGEVGENGMLGAGCVHPTDFQRSALLGGIKRRAVYWV